MKQDINRFLQTKTNRPLLLLNILLATVYFGILIFYFQRGNLVLYTLLMLGELFHLWQLMTFGYTIWNTQDKHKFDSGFKPPVDIFITVCGEPIELVEETLVAIKAMKYPIKNIFVCNDGFVAKKDNWKDIENLCVNLGVGCFTRQKPGGAKAGNLNNALKQTNSDFFVVFDADHVPHSDFLTKTMGYLADDKVAFVQTPQYYKNYAENTVTMAAWEQQSLFFGPILKGKNRLESVFMCGTNMIVRREAVMQVGGMCETNIAEDFLTSLFIHEKGWKSVYVPEILAEGLAPSDFLSYYKQQFRWSRGSLEVIFKYNPLFRKGLTWKQKIQYLASASYYLTGLVVVIDAFLPIIFFYTGLVPIYTATMLIAAIFIPYMIINIYALQYSCNFSFSFLALSYCISSFPIHIKAIWAVLTGQKTTFSVTSKSQIKGNFLNLVIPQIAYIVIFIIGALFAIFKEGLSSSVVTNISWALLNIGVFAPFIISAINVDFIQTKPNPRLLSS